MFENKIKFKDIYEYDLSDKILFKNGKAVIMPKTQSKLLFLLISNIEKVVSYDVIEDFVYNDKPMSNEALRMVIKKIRQKTDQNLIKNISGIGYKISY